ncbi:Pimeloyl-ACP methyl ester carboxylesterase [Rhodoferax sp. OV413]|uniref:alpha/beta fold hydrolase n=1 Tax=Rhodoferax sp. OV413 TaxID=1855285 RepID=UPI0008860029|nr:alpha/beta hydrolase [Rhodoferax sp. OV413]SDO68304.1 Pimeloyl-ACP methyl ester carboxylesterase [Rhodoferax sp. OV413]
MKFDRLERRRLQRSGLPLAFFDAQQGRIPVVFQHGLCGSAQQTAEAFPDDAELRLLSLECRGHGQSPTGPVEALSIAQFSDDVIALIESEKLERVVLGGISMGAAIALRIAVKRPELVGALVLVRPAWVTESAPANMQPNAEVGTLLAQFSPERARECFEQSATAKKLAASAPDNLATLRGFFNRQPQADTSALLRRISADGPGVGPDDVRAIRVPALVLGHEGDAIHPLAHARSLAQLLPRAQLGTITPKSVSREAYVHDLHAALRQFIQSLPS